MKKYLKLPDFYRRLPIVIERGRNIYLYDTDGNKYMDFILGWGSKMFGHNFKPAMDVLKKAELLTISNHFHNKYYLELRDYIYNRYGKLIYLFNSGSETIEFALKIIRKITKENKIFVQSGDYHGRTTAAVNCSFNKKYLKGFIKDVKNYVPFLWTNEIAGNMAGVLLEPIQGAYGMVKPVHPDFLLKVQEKVKENNGLLIFDEIQSSFRYHKDFYGANKNDLLQPDITCISKIIGFGFPVSAVLIHEEIMNFIEQGDYGSTYSMNPLASQLVKRFFEIKDNYWNSDLIKYIKKEIQNLHENNYILGYCGNNYVWSLEFKTVEKASLIYNILLSKYKIIVNNYPKTRNIKIFIPYIMEKYQFNYFINSLKEIINEKLN